VPSASVFGFPRQVNDYTHQMAVRRRQFIREQTGAELSHVAPTVPLLPPGFVVASPYDATTYTFTGGPQFSLCRFRTVTFFIRPLRSGGMHESVTAKPTNPVLTQIVAGLIAPV
jgi:hypothetical protein